MNDELLKIKDCNKFKIINWKEQNEKRVFIDVSKDEIVKVSEFLFNDIYARFMTASGVPLIKGFEIVYHWELPESKIIVNIRTIIKEKDNPEIDAITPKVPPANFIEREISELFGIKFKGHPQDERLILPRDWEKNKPPLKRS